MVEFRDAVKYLRNELGLTQTELANALHVNLATVGRWEKGRNLPNRSITAALLELARAKSASGRCIEILRQAIDAAARGKLPSAGDSLYTVEHASLRELIDDASFPIYVCDMETDELLYINEKAEKMIGGPLPSLSSRKCYRCLMHTSAPCSFCHKNELSFDRFTCYEAVRLFDGEIYRVQGKRIRWNGRDAHVRYVTGTDTNRQLRSIVENMNGGVTVVAYGEDGSVRHAYRNNCYYDMFGYTAEQFAGELNVPFAVVVPEDVETVRAEMERVRATGQPATFRYRGRKRDGSVIHVRCSSSLASIEGLGDKVVLSVMTDVTATVLAEQRALVFGQRLSAIMGNINNGVVASIIHGDGSVEYVFVTDRYYEMLGYTKEQYHREVPDPFDRIYSEDADKVREEASAMKHIGENKKLIYRAVRRDGRIIWLDVQMSMMTFADADEPVQLSVFTDITPIAEANERLAAQRDQIQEMLNTTPSGIAVIEMDPRDPASLRTIYYNDRFFSYTGYTREEYDAILRKDELSFVFAEDKPLLIADTVKICAGEIGASESSIVRCHTKDGGYRWLLLTGQLAERRGDTCVVKVSLVDITARKEAEDKLRVSEEMLRIAAETDKRALILYDVKANACLVESRDLYAAEFGQTIPNVPDSLIDIGLAAPESEQALYDLFARMRAGEEKVSVSLQLRTGDSEYQWFECNAATVPDADGNPDHAVLVFHNITEQRLKEAVFKKWQQSIESRPPETYTLFRCNLTRRAMLDEQEGRLLKITFGPELLDFNERTKAYVDRFVYPDDQAAYVAALDSDTLLAMFYRGQHSETLEYREIREDGTSAWRRLTVELVEYLNSTDVQAFLLYEDIDEQKRAELRERELAQTDPLTGLLNRTAFAEKAEEVLGQQAGAQHALLMLDMDGFKQINDTFGHAAGDQALLDTAAILRSMVRDSDLICRLGGDEFLVWLRDIAYDAVIDKIARQICEQVRKAFSEKIEISASVGVAVYPRDGREFDELYHNADKALYRVKQTGKNDYAFFSAGERTQPEAAPETVEAVRPVMRTGLRVKRRMLIVDDSSTSRAVLESFFKDEYLIETAKNGAEAMVRLRHFGTAISIVLLDLIMPGMDGYEILRKMQANVDLKTIPVIVVSGDGNRDTGLRAIECGAADYVEKLVDPELIQIRVKSAVSKAENERLRAQNSYLQLQRDEVVKFHTVLESTGTVVIEYDWRNHVFIYDNTISNYLAGNYNNRSLWQVFLSDMVADSEDVKALQNGLLTLSNDRSQNKWSRLVLLKTPGNQRHWFRVNAYKQVDAFGLAEKMIITFNDVHEEVISSEKLLFQATRDELTGLYNRAGFIEKAAEMIALREPGYYVLSCLDIEKFKVINDQYGSDKGDEVLRQFAKVLESLNNGREVICCRAMADNFAVLYPARLLDTPEIAASHVASEVLDGSLPPLKTYAGRCVIDDKQLPISAIYDRAAIAMDTVKGRYDAYVATYDESMRTALLRQQEITGQMRQALESGQFEVWLQPQFNHATGMLSGAEALVRWRHPKEGIISPAEFIPIFERNGFVYEVDKFVWEQTCILLRKWLDQGLNPVPVSVNISRCDVFRDDLIDVIQGLVQRYDLPCDLLRLEITESAFSESADQIIRVVEKLVELGFVVEIDDFGSGYSSLNTLKDVPAQVLKMDMKFLENDSNAQRGGSIIESVARMAKWLGMSMIAEGVETIEQADYLKSIGCEYVQGYLYARPTQAGEYERLFIEGKTERKHSGLQTMANWNNNEFWNPKSMETLIFNSYVGGACIFEYCNGETELLRMNEQYARELGALAPDGLRPNVSAIQYMDDDNRSVLFNAVEQAIATKREATCELMLSGGDDGEQVEYIRCTLRVIAKSAERYLFYCVTSNITTQRLAEQKEREAERKSRAAAEQLQAIVGNIDGGVSATVFRNGGFEYLFTNDRFYALLGYTKEEFVARFAGELDVIHPDDRQRIRERAERSVIDQDSYSMEYRIVHKGGEIRWLRRNVTIMELPGTEEPVHLSVIMDITRQIESNQQLQFLNDMARDLLAQPDAGRGLTATLQKLREYFGGDRAYIFEFDFSKNTAKNTYESCAEGVSREKNNLQSVPLATMAVFLTEFERQYYYAVEDVETLSADDHPERAPLLEQGIRSLFAVPLYRDNQLIGLLGIDNPCMQFTQMSRLVAIGDYIAVLLTRRDLNAQIIREDNELLSHLKKPNLGLRELSGPAQRASKRIVPPRVLMLITCLLCAAALALLTGFSLKGGNAVKKSFSESVLTLSEGWTLTDGAGTSREATLPETLPCGPDGTYTLSCTLPSGDGLLSNPVLSVYSNYVDVSVSLDGEPLYTYAGTGTSARRATGNTYHFIRLPEDYAGRTLTVDLACQLGNDITYLVKAPQLGAKATMLVNSVMESLPFILLTGGMLIISTVLLALYLTWRRRIDMGNGTAYMALFAGLFAIYVFCETSFAQIVIPDGIMLFSCTLMLLALIPISFVGVLAEDVSRRYKHVPDYLMLLCAANLTVQMVLNYTGVASFRAMIPFTHAVLVISIVSMLACLLLSDRMEVPGSRRKLLSAVPIFVGGLADITLIAVDRASLNNSLWFTLGVATFIILQFCGLARGFFIMYRMSLEADMLRDMAYRDALTGIGNRNAYERRLKELSAGHPDERLCCIMLDIVNLKRINDQYGNDTGDAAIAETGRILEEMLPDCASFYRISGDGFIVLLDGYDKQRAGDLAEKLVQRAERRGEEYAIPLHLAVGYGAYETADESVESFVRRINARVSDHKQAYHSGHADLPAQK